MNKAKLREQMLQRLNSLREDKKEREKRTTDLNRHITQFLRQKSGTWAGYIALSTEPDILQAIDNSPHIQWVYPRVVDQDLQFHKCSSRASFLKSSFGVLEPQSQLPTIDATSINGFLVPGIAFGRDGARLGRGKGFYDRTLQQTKAERVGVCFSMQLFNKGHVPTEEGDVFLDLTISDEGVQTHRHPLEER